MEYTFITHLKLDQGNGGKLARLNLLVEPIQKAQQFYCDWLIEHKQTNPNRFQTSQQCSVCGFVSRENRKTQAQFICLNCGHEENADVQASRSIAKRFGDQELNGLDFRHVKALLELRFRQGLPDAGRASAGLDADPGLSAQLSSAS